MVSDRRRESSEVAWLPVPSVDSILGEIARFDKGSRTASSLRTPAGAKRALCLRLSRAAGELIKHKSTACLYRNSFVQGQARQTAAAE
jgi:hypothetical protein